MLRRKMVAELTRDDGLILLALDTADSVPLLPQASVDRLWAALGSNPRAMREIIAELAEVHSPNASAIGGDVLAFNEDLRACNLISAIADRPSQALS